MQKVAVFLTCFLVALSCAAKPPKAKKPKLAPPTQAGENIQTGVRAECKQPPEPPQTFERLGCMWDEDSDRACCANGKRTTAEDGGIWECVEYVCQNACETHWIPIDRRCQLVGTTDERPAKAKKHSL